jgi:hypothetical protein
MWSFALPRFIAQTPKLNAVEPQTCLRRWRRGGLYFLLFTFYLLPFTW